MASQTQLDETGEVLQHLTVAIGPRPATSRQEAIAAAYINGRLRNAGLKVSADRLTSARGRSLLLPILSLLAATSALFSFLMPLAAFAGALTVLGLLLVDSLVTPLPTLSARRESQNILGTRAVQGSGGLLPRMPRWRVVLLAPLDSPPLESGLRALAGLNRLAVGVRLGAVALIALIALWMVVNESRWWYLQIGPAIYLVLTALIALWPAVASGRDGGAGALTVLFEAARQLQTLQLVELWTVALGATSTDNSGLHDLLKRYPFPRERTLLITLAAIDRGQLVYVTREGALRAQPADPLLLQVAAQADDADPAIDAEPRPYYVDGTLAAPLYVGGYRTLTLLTRGQPGDLPVDLSAVERAARLVVGIVRLLERTETR